MEKLVGMRTFVRVVEAGSFTEAAKVLGHSTSYVSKEITKLEHRLGLRLLNRSTRTLSLTEEGRLYYERSKSLVEEAEALELSLTEGRVEPKGCIKISAPISFGVDYLNKLIPAYLKMYPNVQIDIDLDDRMVDVIAEGYDLVIRTTDLKDSNLIAKTLMTTRLYTLASPEYLKEHGEPKHPKDLINHKCITYSLQDVPNYWEYQNKDGSNFGVKVESVLQSNHSSIHIEAAKSGLGIIRMPSIICSEFVKSGELLPILEGYQLNPLTISAVYPHRQYMSAKVKTFIAFLVEQLKG